jgi:hypothetical protein
MPRGMDSAWNKEHRQERPCYLGQTPAVKVRMVMKPSFS